MHSEVSIAFPWLLAVAIAAGLAVFGIRGRREGWGFAPALALMLGVVAFAIVGAKLHSIYERGWYVGDLSSELAIGWRASGGILGALLALGLLRPILLPTASFLRLGDLFAVNAAVAMMILRISCFLDGCCIGAVCSEPWCVTYQNGSLVFESQVASGLLSPDAEASLGVFPLHMALLGVSASVTAFLLYFDGKRRFDGEVLLLFLFMHEGAKFFLEFLREPPQFHTSAAALAAALFGALGLAGVSVFRRRAEMADRQQRIGGLSP